MTSDGNLKCKNNEQKSGKYVNKFIQKSPKLNHNV